MYVNLYVCFCPPYQRAGVLMQPQDRKAIPHEVSEEEEEAVDGPSAGLVLPVGYLT